MKNTEAQHASETAEGLPFSSVSLREELLKNLATLDYKNMTPIQAQSLPIMLAGFDLIAQAKTGSGKTAAFGLALLNCLNTDIIAPKALVLCPTRELAEQVSQALRRLARLLPNVKIQNLSGGMPLKPQMDSLKHGIHIIVGTPGRVQKHLDKASLSLSCLQTLVLDEADRMLDMGFFDAIQNVISFCPNQRQTLLFSATFPSQVKLLANKFLQNPKHIEITESLSNQDIHQYFYEVPHQAQKFSLLKALLHHHQPTSTLIFCNTKEKTALLTTMLNAEGFSAIALHGDMEQIARDQAMIRFANHSCSILVATDVAARGLDIKELPTVINYDLAFEYDVHIHRIGRTGRAGSKGIAINITTPTDAETLCTIEHNLAKPLTFGNSEELNNLSAPIDLPPMVTLCLSSGRKDKIRPGDILGALTKDAGLTGDSIGNIDVLPLYSYVAILRSEVKKAYHYLQTGTLKGRKVRVKKL